MRRALVVCADPGVPIHGPSGASAHLRGVARGLSANSLDVGVAALLDADARGRHDVPLGVPAVTGRLPWLVGRHRREPWPQGLRGLGQRLDSRAVVERAIRSFGPPDLVWERASLHGDGGLRAATRLGVPLVLELNAPLSLEARRDGSLGHTLAGAALVGAVSPWLVDWARGQGASRVVHLPNGSDLLPVDRSRARERLGLDGRVLVHHGSLRPRHGVALLAPVLDRLPDATLLLVGDGPTLDHPRVVHHPSADPPVLAELLAASDVLLAPFAADAPPWLDPLKLRDAAAVGLPSVASVHPSTHGATARVPLDPDRWAGAIRELTGVRLRPERRPWATVCREALDHLGS